MTEVIHPPNFQTHMEDGADARARSLFDLQATALINVVGNRQGFRAA